MKRLLIFSLIISCALFASSRSATQFFTTAPDSIFRLLPQSVRLDMVDYFNYGSQRASENFFRGPAKVTALSDHAISLEVDNDVEVQIAVIPVGKSDTIIAMTTTLRLPVPDSSIKFYDTAWRSLKKSPLTFPSYSDWLTADGKKDIADIQLHLPFIPVSATFSDDATTLTLRNEAAEYLDSSVYSKYKNYLIREIVYETTNKRFSIKK